jgi:prefoldin subunit 5
MTSIRDSKEREYRALVDVGSKCLMQAVVEEPKSVYVHVGAGFHVELGFEEAIELSHKRIDILRRCASLLHKASMP